MNAVKSTKYTPYKSMYHLLSGTINTTPAKVYQSVYEEIVASCKGIDPHLTVEYMRCDTEDAWHRNNCCYVKMKDREVPPLEKAIDNFSPYIKERLSTFLMMFPASGTNVAAQNVLVHPRLDESRIIIWVDRGRKEKKPPHPALLEYTILDMDGPHGFDDPIVKIGEASGLPDVTAILREAIRATILVAAGALEPDILAKDRIAYREAKAKADHDTCETIVNRAIRRRKMRGYLFE